MKIRICHLPVLILFLIPGYCFSTHIVGGEITYIYSGNNNYEIHMMVYRDCYNGTAPFDDPAPLGIFDANNNLVNSYQVPLSISIAMNNSPYNCFPLSPSNICYEVGTYILNVNLPPISGGYQISYQRCCRTVALNNIVNPQTSGLTCYATIPDSLYSENSSPVFNNLPFTFLCANVPFTFDNSATDADGDSLVYSLNTPLLGGSNISPAPDPPSNPPYADILWLSPYSISDIMGGTAMAINSQTGLLSGTPNMTGVYQYGVSVMEYRNGIYIGETNRDFQINVITNVGIEENKSDQYITCYSNQFDNSITFKIDPGLFLENAEVIIYDVTGKEAGMIKNISKHNFSFNRNNIDDGIYFYKFLNSGKLSGKGKIILLGK